MSELLSRQIDQALGALDATPNPSRDQLLELLASQRKLMVHTRDFAQAIETAHRTHPGTVPMVAASTAAARLYRDLAGGVDVPADDGSVIRLDLYRGGRR